MVMDAGRNKVLELLYPEVQEEEDSEVQQDVDEESAVVPPSSTPPDDEPAQSDVPAENEEDAHHDTCAICLDGLGTYILEHWNN